MSQKLGVTRERLPDVTLSNYAGSVDLLVLPRVSSERGRGSKTAGGAPLLPNVVRVAAAPPAPDVGSFSPGLAE